MNVLYFGCMNGPGHYLHDKLNSRRRYSETPWGNELDSPPSTHQGISRIEQKDGWTALGFTDNSVDTRPGSHSIFLVEGLVSAPELLEMAQKEWPQVFARFRFKVVLPTPPAVSAERGQAL